MNVRPPKELKVLKILKTSNLIIIIIYNYYLKDPYRTSETLKKP